MSLIKNIVFGLSFVLAIIFGYHSYMSDNVIESLKTNNRYLKYEIRDINMVNDSLLAQIKQDSVIISIKLTTITDLKAKLKTIKNGKTKKVTDYLDADLSDKIDTFTRYANSN